MSTKKLQIVGSLIDVDTAVTEGSANPISSGAVYTELNSHIQDTDNPHGVTAEQIGALTQVFSASDSAPSNTKLLWIDTANGGIMKYHDGSAWVAVASVWS